MRPIYWFCWTLARLSARIIFRLKIFNEDNIPKEGTYLIACNHKSYVDPPFAGICYKRPIHFMAKKELFDNWFLGNLIKRLNAHPVNRGGFDRKAIKLAFSILGTGTEAMLVFPEGTRSRTDEFLPAKPGVGMMAIKGKVAVLPMYFHGSNHLWDCFLGRVKMSAIIGEMITVSEISEYPENRDGYQELSDEIMRRIVNLKEDLSNRVKMS